ncbi:glutaredoxin [Leptospirillum ferriphilum ML-04]|uniref:Glutaredoxin n=1 Tax=Leptospirillum ferriphilum (strain ML-04) TaxID=1048260 RepID=J9Z8Q2_LEPFM|nr:glutaredoxin [Leptospirillum ferriphilum ML-04]
MQDQGTGFEENPDAGEKAVLSRVLQFGYNCERNYLSGYKEVLVSETKESIQVKAYLKPTCGWSNGVRAVLRKYSLPYEDIDILSNPVAYMEMVKKSHQRLSPCVEINGVMLADVSGEEVESYLLQEGLVERVESSDNTPTNQGCPSH